MTYMKLLSKVTAKLVLNFPPMRKWLPALPKGIRYLFADCRQCFVVKGRTLALLENML